MSFRHTAAQFFQNAADYLDPRAAWENKRAVHHELTRRAKGNFTGRESTPEEARQKMIEQAKKSNADFNDRIAAFKAKRGKQNVI